MRHEKTFKRDDGSRVKVEVRLEIEYHRKPVFAYWDDLWLASIGGQRSGLSWFWPDVRGRYEHGEWRIGCETCGIAATCSTCLKDWRAVLHEQPRRLHSRLVRPC